MVEINFEKLKIEIQSLEQSSGDKIANMKSMLADMESTIQVEMRTKAELTSNHQALETEITQLKDKSTALSAEEESLSNNIATLKDDLRQLEDQLQTLKTEKAKVEREVNEHTSTVRTLDNEIRKTDSLISTEEATITHANVSTQAQQDSMEVEMNKAKIERAKAETYTRLLKLLLEDKYINLSYFDVCKVLTQQGVNTVDRLVMASGVDRNTVEETLRELSQRGVVGYLPGGGEFEIIKPFQL